MSTDHMSDTTAAPRSDRRGGLSASLRFGHEGREMTTFEKVLAEALHGASLNRDHGVTRVNDARLIIAALPAGWNSQQLRAALADLWGAAAGYRDAVHLCGTSGDVTEVDEALAGAAQALATEVGQSREPYDPYYETPANAQWMPTMTEPKTTAGRALLAACGTVVAVNGLNVAECILAIEAEAIAAFTADDLPGLLAEAVKTAAIDATGTCTLDDHHGDEYAAAIAVKVGELHGKAERTRVLQETGTE